MSEVIYRQINEETRPATLALAAQSWGATVVAVHGELYDLSDLLCFVALCNNEVVGYCFYRYGGTECILCFECAKACPKKAI